LAHAQKFRPIVNPEMFSEFCVLLKKLERALTKEALKKEKAIGYLVAR
jgi:hypothetical protein